MLRSIEQELCASLTPAQMEVYRACLLGCVSYKDYADDKGVSYQSVRQAVALIRKKASKIFLYFFEGYLCFGFQMSVVGRRADKPSLYFENLICSHQEFIDWRRDP